MIINENILSASEDKVMELLLQDEKYWESVESFDSDDIDSDESAENIDDSEWDERQKLMDEDEEWFQEEVSSWEEKRTNKKYIRNSAFKNKLRDKAILYTKAHLKFGKIDERFVNLNIINIQKVEPIHLFNGTHNIQWNAKQWFFGKPVNTNIFTVNGQRVGYPWNPKGSRSWRAAWKRVDKAREKESFKQEIIKEVVVPSIIYDWENEWDYLFEDDDICF